MMDIAKFFERKIGELSSNNLTEKEASLNKPREENPGDSMGLETDDAFSQGLKSPECVKILFNCLQNLETEMKSIKEISLAAKDWQIKRIEELNDMSKAINFINKKFEDFEKTLKEKEEEIKLLEKVNNYLNKRLEEMDAVADKQEQYSRRNCLLVHGIVEETVEDTDEKVINTLQQSMDETIKPEYIDRSHRLGKPKSSKNAKPRPIILKFVRYSTRDRIYRKKKKLKGTGISVTKSLTAKRMNMLEKAGEKYTFNNAFDHKMVRLCFLIKIQTKLILIMVNFFSFGNEPDQLWRKKIFYSNFA